MALYHLSYKNLELRLYILRTVPTNKEVFFGWLIDCVGKADLSKGYLNAKRKLGVTTHFLEIINQQLFKKTVKYKAMYGVFFQIEALLSVKNAWLPQLFFLDTKSTC